MEQSAHQGHTSQSWEANYDINLLLKWEGEPSDRVAVHFCDEFMKKFKSRYSIFYPPEHQLAGSRYFDIPDSKFTVVVITDTFLKSNTMKYIQEVFLMKHLESENHHFIPVAIGLNRKDLPRDLQGMSVIHFDFDFMENIKEWDRLEKSIRMWTSCDKEDSASYQEGHIEVVGELWRPALPVSYYFERTELHHKLHEHMRKFQCLVLSGIHGCGKTQLARFLVYNSSLDTEAFQNRPHPDDIQKSKSCGVRRNTTTGIRFEVNCHSVDKMLGSLVVLAKHVGLDADDYLCRNPSDGAKQLLERILEILDQNWCTHHNILLFEDVKRKTDSILTPSMIEKCTHTKIIVTTNIEVLWPLCQKYCVPITGFTQSEAIQFFRTDNEHCKETDGNIILLGERLSFLPLGLAVAKMFMVLYCESIEDYLDLLPDNFMEENILFKESEYDKGVIATMQRTLESIKMNIGEESFRAIDIVALLAPYRIPLQVVRKALPGSYQQKLLKERKIIEQLRDHSLASFQKNDKNQSIMAVHEIVQLALELN